MCESCPADALAAAPTMVPVEITPSANAVAVLADAERPLIIVQRCAGSAEGFAALASLATEWAIPVCQYWAVQLGIATDHEMRVGMDPGPFLAEADVVLVIDSLAPWSPAIQPPPPKCTMIQAGPDPLCARFPVRNFPCDLALAGDTADPIIAIQQVLRPAQPQHAAAIGAPRARIAQHAPAIRTRALEAARAGGAGERMTKARVSHYLSDAIAGRTASVLSELGSPLEPMTLRDADRWFQEPHSGGLGKSFPTALRLQLAQPDRLAVAIMGDGSYMFANPVVCHQTAEAMHCRCSFSCSTIGSGARFASRWWACIPVVMPRAPTRCRSLRSSRPRISRWSRASRAWTASVVDPAKLPAALQAAIAHVTTMRTHALVEIAIIP